MQQTKQPVKVQQVPPALLVFSAAVLTAGQFDSHQIQNLLRMTVHIYMPWA